MKTVIFLPIFLSCGLGLIKADEPIIEDVRFRKAVEEKLGILCEEKQGLNGEALRKQLKAAPASVCLNLPEVKSNWYYDSVVPSVGFLTSVYNCGKCSKWHVSGGATAWCLAEDGVFVTNYHCFDSTAGEAHAVAMHDGRVALVEEILAADEAGDICLFRVQGDGFSPLPLGEMAEIGERVRIVSHPAQLYFMQTSGEVARYFHQKLSRNSPSRVWMTVTAEFAKGSSGGPVYNERGEVVGVVSRTQSIYSNASGATEKGPAQLQMVVNNCVSAPTIRALIKSPEEKPTEEKPTEEKPTEEKPTKRNETEENLPSEEGSETVSSE